MWTAPQLLIAADLEAERVKPSLSLSLSHTQTHTHTPLCYKEQRRSFASWQLLFSSSFPQTSYKLFFHEHPSYVWLCHLLPVPSWKVVFLISLLKNILFILKFYLEDGCLAALFLFLPYNDVNQPQGHICPLPLEPPSHVLPPIPPTPNLTTLGHWKLFNLSALHFALK